MSRDALARARAGDEQAFADLIDAHRAELRLHSYRLLGSLDDADDVLQEALIAAWRNLDRFQERASLRTWLYRIVTTRSLNAIRDRGRRPATVTLEPPWLQPFPDALLPPEDEQHSPDARFEAKESIALAFIAALQQLPARQRAVLVLRDVLGFRAAEVGDMLDTSEASVNSALLRARAQLEARPHRRETAALPSARGDRELVERFAVAFEGGDVDAIVALLADDVRVSMPPAAEQHHGVDAARVFFNRVEDRLRDLRLTPARFNGQPGYEARHPDGRPHGAVVLTIEQGRVTTVLRFPDTRLSTA